MNEANAENKMKKKAQRSFLLACLPIGLIAAYSVAMAVDQCAGLVSCTNGSSFRVCSATVGGTALENATEPTPFAGVSCGVSTFMGNTTFTGNASLSVDPSNRSCDWFLGGVSVCVIDAASLADGFPVELERFDIE